MALRSGHDSMLKHNDYSHTHTLVLVEKYSIAYALWFGLLDMGDLSGNERSACFEIEVCIMPNSFFFLHLVRAFSKELFIKPNQIASMKKLPEIIITDGDGPVSCWTAKENHALMYYVK